MAHQDQQHPKASGWLQQVAPGLAALAHYNKAWLPHDVAAGLSVAAVALPVGIAYADLAGVPAVYGMYAAIFPLFAYALFGSSRQLMTGPDAATCIMVAAILGPLAAGDSARYQALMVLITLTTGLIYILGGIIRLGFIANFFSQPILAGYLNGIALIIMSGQLQKLLGYPGEADGFYLQLRLFLQQVDQAHLPTLALGLGLLGLMLLMKRFTPRLPQALVVVILGILLVTWLQLEQHGVAVLGTVPSGFPGAFNLPALDLGQLKGLLRDAAGLVLVSFTSGILTAKSFARRNGYEVDANRELFGFGACNLASGLAQGFPVTGADSRTAVNNAMGGKTQLVGVFAAVTMLVILIYFTEPLTFVPNAALAAVIMVAAIGLFDLGSLKALFRSSRREFTFSVLTTLGVLFLGVLPGVLLAIMISLLNLLMLSSRPPDAILGRVQGMKGFHSLDDYPDAKTLPGLLVYRFEADVVFYNADYFKQRVLNAVHQAETEVEWVVIDASPVSIVDVTAIAKFDELRDELAERGILLAVAQERRNVERMFEGDWANVRRKLSQEHNFTTLKSAVRAFRKRDNPRAVAQLEEAPDESGEEGV